jgi:hypothetical protein
VKPPSSHVATRPSANTYAALALLGVNVTALELPTIPYFAAIALIVEAALPIRTWALLLVVYNLIFISRRSRSSSDISPSEASGRAVCCLQAMCADRQGSPDRQEDFCLI